MSTVTAHKLSANKAAATCHQIPNKIAELAESMRLECAEIIQQWEGLGRIGAQREDHAAELLKRLLPQLRKVSSFVETVEQQLSDVIADPFA